ncbi:MAG: hypothetical protein ACYCQK_08475 [Acidiferrobacteraceae bacterium]
MKSLAVVTIALMALGGCATAGHGAKPVSATGHEAAAQAVAKAQAAVRQTAAMAVLWTTTAVDLKKAEQAEKKGENARAIQLANAVVEQTTLAQTEARSQENVRPSYPK